MNDEPVLIVNFVEALIALAVVFGLGLPMGASVAILAAVKAALALYTRSQVTPSP